MADLSMPWQTRDFVNHDISREASREMSREMKLNIRNRRLRIAVVQGAPNNSRTKPLVLLGLCDS